MLPSCLESEWDIEEITEYCQGVKGLDLGAGISSLPIPQELMLAVENTMPNRTAHCYSSPKGIGELRKSVADKLYQFNHIIASPEEEIIITHGATGALTCAIKVLFNPGDEVLLFEPFYPAHKNLLEFFGVEVKLVPLDLGDLSFDLDQLKHSISSKTRGILLCNPANPLGKVFQESELKDLSRIAEKYNLSVISDEIYEYITYFPYQHISFASIGNNSSRTVTISGFSKTYNATGWRLGYAAGPSNIIRQMIKIQDLLYVCPVTPLQYAAKGVLFVQDSYYRQMIQFYQKQRDLVVNTFIELGFKPIIPQGAYYTLIDISSGFKDDKAASHQFLQRTKIATIPGRIFFKSPIGKNYIRVCFAKSVKRLPEILYSQMSS